MFRILKKLIYLLQAIMLTCRKQNYCYLCQEEKQSKLPTFSCLTGIEKYRFELYE